MNLDQGSINFHPLAYVIAPALTPYWYFSDQAISLSNGKFAAPRLSIDRVQEVLPVPISYTANPFKQPLSITLDDHDGTLYPIFYATNFAKGLVYLYYGWGSTISDYTQVYKGEIMVPNGISEDEFHITINSCSGMEYENRQLPITPVTDYANHESKSEGKFIPIVYGDWSGPFANGVVLPIICTNTVAKEFKIANHNLKAITTVYKNWVVVVPDTTDLAVATFTLTTAGYDETKDEVWASVEGKSDNVLGGGNLIEHPVDVVQDLLTTYLGATGLIDAATFATAKAAITALGMTKCRGFITERSLAMYYVMQLCDECGLDLMLKNGTFYLYCRDYNPTIAATHYIQESDIVKGSYGVVRDPQNIYGNKLLFSYAYSPFFGNGRSRADAINAAEVVAAAITVDKDYDFMWLWDNTATAVNTRAAAICDLISSRIPVITLELKYRGFQYVLGDAIALNYKQWSNTKFQIRSIQRVFGSQPRVQVELWGMYNYPQVSTV